MTFLNPMVQASHVPWTGLNPSHGFPPLLSSAPVLTSAAAPLVSQPVTTTCALSYLSARKKDCSSLSLENRNKSAQSQQHHGQVMGKVTAVIFWWMTQLLKDLASSQPLIQQISQVLKLKKKKVPSPANECDSCGEAFSTTVIVKKHIESIPTSLHCHLNSLMKQNKGELNYSPATSITPSPANTWVSCNSSAHNGDCAVCGYSTTMKEPLAKHYRPHNKKKVDPQNMLESTS